MLKGDHQRIILANLNPIGPVVSEGKNLNFIPPFQFFATVAMFVWMSGLPDTILKGGHPGNI